MFFYDNVNELGVKKLHIEPTNRCNSRCPHCPRTNSVSIKNSGIKLVLVEQTFSSKNIYDFKYK